MIKEACQTPQSSVFSTSVWVVHDFLFYSLFLPLVRTFVGFGGTSRLMLWLLLFFLYLLPFLLSWFHLEFFPQLHQYFCSLAYFVTILYSLCFSAANFSFLFVSISFLRESTFLFAIFWISSLSLYPLIQLRRLSTEFL